MKTKNWYLIPGILFLIGAIVFAIVGIQEILDYWQDIAYIAVQLICLVGCILAAIYCWFPNKFASNIKLYIIILVSMLLSLPFSIFLALLLACMLLSKLTLKKLFVLLGTAAALLYAIAMVATPEFSIAGIGLIALWVAEEGRTFLAIALPWWKDNGDDVKAFTRKSLKEGGSIAKKGFEKGKSLAKEGMENFSKWGATANPTMPYERQLLILKEQFDSGNITQEEYEQKRADLLSQL